MRVLVACEFSGIVRRAFRDAGHDAWSCDLLPAQDDSQFHITGDVLRILSPGTFSIVWQMMIAFPPCTHLAVSGAKWFHKKKKEQTEALNFVRKLMDAPIPRIAIENPVGVISSKIRRPDQIIQPYQFGDAEMKTTCLWLKNLPPLVPPELYQEGTYPNRLFRLPPSPDRGKLRSVTFHGIADAMAEQWGDVELAKLREGGM